MCILRKVISAHCQMHQSLANHLLRPGAHQGLVHQCSLSNASAFARIKQGMLALCMQRSTMPKPALTSSKFEQMIARWSLSKQLASSAPEWGCRSSQLGIVLCVLKEKASVHHCQMHQPCLADGQDLQCRICFHAHHYAQIFMHKVCSYSSTLDGLYLRNPLRRVFKA